MENLKCTLCKTDKPVSSFYKNKGMPSGYANQCKKCVIERARKRQIKLYENKEWLEKERERGREKYKRLNYKDKYKGRKDFIKDYSLYRDLHRNLKAKGLVNETQNVHHWNYNLIDDYFILDRRMHHRIHTYLTLDKDTLCFYTKDGILLDSREKHLTYIESIKRIIENLTS